jgi:hypothetical protein
MGVDMMPRSSNICSFCAALLLSIALGASPALAEGTIFEVQVDQAAGLLVIYGTDFGPVSPADGQPVITFGTQMPPLVIAADQTPCTAPPPPPLDPNGIECVVAELPSPTPDGDYLLCVEAEAPAASCETDGKPIALTFEYTGEACDPLLDNTQEGKFQCSLDPNGAEPVQVICDDGDCNADPSDASVDLFSEVTLTPTGNNFPADTDIQVRSPIGQVLQDLRIHTSCSKPLATGDRFGSLTLTEFIPVGGSVSPVVCYDLTIGGAGAEGPQGIQGKKGDQGDQGIQGKKGDQGDQGIQGKKGDQGDQGIQGKKGDQGDQGIQGKKGDQGDQGIQGKKGDQGDQGIQGKKGDQGDQGIQGKKGDQGDQGPQGKIGAAGPQGIQGKKGDQGDQGPQGKIGPAGPQGEPGLPPAGVGIGSGLICFSTDQTIGTTGKYMGLGNQAGSHDLVSVVVPFADEDDSTVVNLTVKVSQGTNERSGFAQLFHDGPTDAGLPITPDEGQPGACTLTPDPDPVDESTTKCMVTLDPGVILAEKDSLSVFVKADNGNFEAATACVVLVRGAE